MTIRITGMNSGLDTEAIIKELASARSVKVENIKKDQTKLSWKIDAWKNLNTKIYSFYSDVLSDMRFDYAYSKKTTKVSNPNAVSVVTSGNAVDGVQSMKIKKLAKSSYLTGGEIKGKAASFTGGKVGVTVGSLTGSELKLSNGDKASNETTLADLGIGTNDGEAMSLVLEHSNGTKITMAGFTGASTLEQVASSIDGYERVEAKFDETTGQFVIKTNNTGETFTISAVVLNEDKTNSNEVQASQKLVNTLGLAGMSQPGSPAAATTLANFGLAGNEWKLDVTVGGVKKELTFTAADTLEGVAAKLDGAGLKARFDAEEGRFVIGAKVAGQSFSISAAGGSEASASLLEKLGLQGAAAVQPAGTVNNGTTKLSELGIGTDGSEVKFKLKVAGKTEEVTLKGSQTLDDVAAMFKEKGLNAKFDEVTKRFFISAKESGEANGFEIEATDEDGANALRSMGLYYTPGNYYGSDGYVKKENEATMVKAQDAEIELNGATFKSSKNTFEINGLTITALQETKDDETVTLTTQRDTDGIYDMVKNFIKKYNELINEMDKLYNAKSASKYEPLTAEEKDALSDTEVEEWEKKIKEALLRRDTTLYSVSAAMKDAMVSTSIADTAKLNDGKNLYLTFFGIETLGYFKAKENEKNAYHISGDSDDSDVKNNDDKLKKAIASDPDTVVNFFKKLATNLYTALEDKMGRTDYSSAFTVYNDKQMESELKKYESKITTEQKKLNEYTDRWYKKFSQMEVAMGKMQSKQNSITGLFG